MSAARGDFPMVKMDYTQEYRKESDEGIENRLLLRSVLDGKVVGVAVFLVKFTAITICDRIFGNKRDQRNGFAGFAAASMSEIIAGVQRRGVWSSLYLFVKFSASRC